MSRWFFASPYNVTCGDIGNCSAKTPTIDVAFTNAAHLIIGTDRKADTHLCGGRHGGGYFGLCHR
jgi:hypothetical protein